MHRKLAAPTSSSSSSGRTARSRSGTARIGSSGSLSYIAMELVEAYLFNVFNKQIAISRDEAWSGYPPEGFPATIYDPNQEQNNELYGSVTGRSDPRSFRGAIRVSF